MRSSTLIASYLWKDTWKRWFEQPSSPLARLFVTAARPGGYSHSCGFHLMERTLRERLERFGLNTVLVRESITPDSRRIDQLWRRSDRLAPLMTAGGNCGCVNCSFAARPNGRTISSFSRYPPDGHSLPYRVSDRRDPDDYLQRYFAGRCPGESKRKSPVFDRPDSTARGMDSAVDHRGHAAGSAGHCSR